MGHAAEATVYLLAAAAVFGGAAAISDEQAELRQKYGALEPMKPDHNHNGFIVVECLILPDDSKVLITPDAGYITTGGLATERFEAFREGVPFAEVVAIVGENKHYGFGVVYKNSETNEIGYYKKGDESLVHILSLAELVDNGFRNARNGGEVVINVPAGDRSIA